MKGQERLGWPHAPWGTPPQPRGAWPKFAWETVDWSLRDATIARELGCSRERVRQVRAELDKPLTPGAWKRTKDRAARKARAVGRQAKRGKKRARRG